MHGGHKLTLRIPTAILSRYKYANLCLSENLLFLRHLGLSFPIRDHRAQTIEYYQRLFRSQSCLCKEVSSPCSIQISRLQRKVKAEGWDITESAALQSAVGGWISFSREPNGAPDEVKTVEVCREVHQAVATTIEKRTQLAEHPYFN